ncbi:MAG TPA: sigma-70 family RNA polymerase sigma factor [Isosphaeraceae bacterium]|nr:sigma-70 family RNA polymerase sigma factor [Isosphaeraceae bacterium]
MRRRQESSQNDGFPSLDSADIEVLNPRDERSLLQELSACKAKLAAALASMDGDQVPPAADDPQTLANYIASAYVRDGPTAARLGVVYRKYSELRSKLALSNLRLVSHVAKGFRDRGISYSDLMQEGFCGLLEAIDRFDLSHETKLATYATWWIRQSMQRAVASGAYPVRLTPRHLRQLAQNQEVEERALRGESGIESGMPEPNELVQRIHTATRPAISLDAAFDKDSSFNLLQTMSDPDGDRTAEVDADEAIERLIGTLRPREQQVLSLRFGLDGGERLSLSQVGKVLAVSKERVRQIQDRALSRLRTMAEEENLLNRLALSL